jgi:predicted TIM-barrel fold metal-dependent hydrolase
MTTETLSGTTREAASGLAIFDSDIHPLPRTPTEILSFLPPHWREHVQTYGNHVRQPFSNGLSWPKAAPATARRDAWPATGGPPGSDLDFMRRQHLDRNGVECGVLQVLEPGGGRQRNPRYAIALSHAVNDWQKERWTQPEPRLRASIIVAQEEADAAVAEIELRAQDPDFVQILLAPRCEETLGRSRYWPIYAAAERHGLPVAFHVGGANGHPPTAGIGHPSTYFEEHHANVHSLQALTSSLVLEGVFERFPRLKIVVVEAGFAWVPPLAWRLDKHWARMRSEVPEVKRPPSEYIHRHFWFTSQPMDEPEKPDHLRDSIKWIGADRILFASDYPHWDFDDPARAFGLRLSTADQQRIYRDNAREVFRL